jgi:hypothetical protein
MGERDLPNLSKVPSVAGEFGRRFASAGGKVFATVPEMQRSG